MQIVQLLILSALGLLAIWALKGIFGYLSFGLGEGRDFGNLVADSAGIDRKVFHLILDHGDTPAPSLLMLKAMKKSGVSYKNAAVDLSPFLLSGLAKLEGTWGSQQQLLDAKRPILELCERYDEKHRDPYQD